MAIKCGIVGLPNVGKSTLFNALTAAEIPAENYPFCTIEPNVGIVPVPDPRLAVLAGIVNPQKTLPTTMEFVDIAGLVAGASKGEGLGNQFLANIRETNAIAHVVRCFEDDDVTHVTGTISPVDDIETIDTELALADLESVEKQLYKAEKNAKTNDKDAIAIRDALKKTKAHLDQGHPVRALQLDETEQAVLKDLHLLTAKPIWMRFALTLKRKVRKWLLSARPLKLKSHYSTMKTRQNSWPISAWKNLAWTGLFDAVIPCYRCRPISRLA